MHDKGEDSLAEGLQKMRHIVGLGDLIGPCCTRFDHFS